MGLTRALVDWRVVLGVGIGGEAGYSGRRALPYLTKVFSCAGCRTCEWPTRFTVGSGVSPNRAAISAGRRSSNLSIWRAWKEVVPVPVEVEVAVPA
jgi:hypothetical protein